MKIVMTNSTVETIWRICEFNEIVFLEMKELLLSTIEFDKLYFCGY